MKLNKIQKNVEIISELHPQHFGSMKECKRMILQSKLGGADMVKVQLYGSKELFNNEDRSYLEISFDELSELNEFSNRLDIELTASVFDLKRVDWCEKINMKTYKIASVSVKNKELCEKIISLQKRTIISLGMHDYQKLGVPFEGDKIDYLYCVSKYPTNLKEIKMPNFDDKDAIFKGYSDHTIGIATAIFAITRGALIIEKHFSNNKSLNVETQLAHVCSMNSDELENLRNIANSITLLKS